MDKANVKDDEVIAFLVETLERADVSLDPEGLLVAAGARGLELEPRHVRAAFEQLQQRWKSLGELDEAALDSVAGGAGESEEIRNKRQMQSSAFQSFDQKANQTYNLLSSVVKTGARGRPASGAIANTARCCRCRSACSAARARANSCASRSPRAATRDRAPYWRPWSISGNSVA